MRKTKEEIPHLERGTIDIRVTRLRQALRRAGYSVRPGLLHARGKLTHWQRTIKPAFNGGN